jgi:segregation and condensation protein B
MDQPFITRIVEAALLAANQPLSIAQLRGLFTLDEPAPEGSIEQALTDLRNACLQDGAQRGIELAETASGYRFQVQADVHAWVARLWSERQTKYTRATLETLAIIAYRQPITRGEIEQIRGVAVSSNIIKALEEREWIRSVGHRDMPGRPELLGTTKTFLDYFGLKSLEQLPPLSELKDFGELDPQLSLDPDGSKAAALAEAMAAAEGPAPIEAGASMNPQAEGEDTGEPADERADEPASDDTTVGAPVEAGSPIEDQESAHAEPPAASDVPAADTEHRNASDDENAVAPHTQDPTHPALVADDDSTGA